MLTKVFEHNGARITARRADVRARLRAQLVYAKLNISADIPEEEWTEVRAFARFLSQCSVEGDLGFPTPLLSDDAETMRAAKEAFMTADGVLYDHINLALLEVDRDFGDADLVPESELDTKKKTTPESENEEMSS